MSTPCKIRCWPEIFKCKENAKLTPNFPWIHTRKISHFWDVFRSGKTDGIAKFSRICRFVKLLVNEGFLAVLICRIQ